MELYKVLTGETFTPSFGDVDSRIIKNLKENNLMHQEDINEG